MELWLGGWTCAWCFLIMRCGGKSFSCLSKPTVLYYIFILDMAHESSQLITNLIMS